ncbi:type 1 fimbrial protein [Cronobacter turicensis]|nr:type 1 fimbrial protein [Cronobacter turicensis]ELU8456544.1 type 1 fimbrial protein [Cronobacter turicensis]ELY4110377.1 type 1 fimbrial protein [Cronobacter turicensis]ELY4214622.1 type 1 fimbrial protein [Cronobacter turicensis]EMA1792461.1 type 1 fimbrial protein [Cronobacter turicensis]
MKKGLLLMLVIVAAQAQADDINLQINGTITAGSCDVDAASKNKTVEMGQAVASDFSDTAVYGPWVPFELSVINCPATVTSVDAAFSGQLDAHNSTAYANTGTGHGVALQVVDSKNMMYMLPGGDKSTEPVEATTHSATFRMSARYVRTSSLFIPGTFESAVQVTFTYR